MTAKPTLFLCSCDNSQKIDAKAIAKTLGMEGPTKVYEQLCRAEIAALDATAASGAAATICCTQEGPILLQAWNEAESGVTTPTFVNIRETAGWSEDGSHAAAKMAALIAEAQVQMPGTTTVTMTSDGHTLILGSGDVALQAAKRLATHLDVTLLLSKGDAITPPAQGDVPVLAGKVTRVSGHLGQFVVSVDNLSALDPSSRGEARFQSGLQGKKDFNADIVIDLSGGPAHVPAPEKRDGYLRADPANPAAVERVLFDALNLVGEFEKPRYVQHTASACAHARNSIVACTRCLDACPTSAIEPDGDHMVINPHICAGCGECASVCPTGANSYQYPSVSGVMLRAQALLGTYRKGGGEAPALLLTDATYGSEAIAMMARFGRGLPARVLPFTVNTVTSIGLDTLLALMAHGVSRIRLLANPAHADELAPLNEQVATANIILSGLGYGADRIAVLEDADPTVMEDHLWTLPKDTATPGATFTIAGNKRETLSMALGHLHMQAPTPQDRVALPQGAPFGAVVVNDATCTLCLACTSACPTAALKSNPDRPELRFRESACVQCGLCQKTCPEKAITLQPGIDFTGAARNFATLKSEEPFACIRCGTPFGTQSSIEHMMTKLKGHSMFNDPGALERLKMCDVCRVADMTQNKPDPYASGARPATRTTEDYLRERERERTAAAQAEPDPKKLN